MKDKNNAIANVRNGGFINRGDAVKSFLEIRGTKKNNWSNAIIPQPAANANFVVV